MIGLADLEGDIIHQVWHFTGKIHCKIGVKMVKKNYEKWKKNFKINH